MMNMLPIFEIKQAFLDALAVKGQVVISAPTGSGKSTQIPKFLLEAIPQDQRILVLQPRRLATRMLAERIAAEMNTKIGDVVGYQTRYERVASQETRILFITEGILTRMLISNRGLPGVGAIVFDEFHERSINTDLGLAMAAYVRKNNRPDLKLVIMSATLDAEPICDYLGDCPHLHAEGRLFPIETAYLKPPFPTSVYAGVTNAIRLLLRLKKDGDILVFMPGAYEIRKTIEECQKLSWSEPLIFLPLYGDLPPDAQHAVMEPAPKRKVIVATNIAETSLTIPGVRHVIDSGLVRTARYEPARGIDLLETKAIARDAADQRAGRAGREAAGTCQRLWSELEQNAKPSKSIPEIQRLDLAETVLAVASLGFNNPFEFPWFDTPPEKMLREAVALLEKLALLKPDFGGVTELGRQLQAIPAHPRLALLLKLGADSGCLRLAAMAAAIVAERPLVTNSSTDNEIRKQHRQDAKQKKRHEDLPQSDFLHLTELLDIARNAHFAPDVCQSLGIHPAAARDVSRATDDLIRNAQRLHWGENAVANGNPELAFLRCLLRTFPDRLAKRRDNGSLLCDIPNDRRAELDKNSVARDEPLFIAAEIREANASGVQASKLVLSLASGIREEWLWEDFPDGWKDVNEVLWDERQQRVVNRSAITCLGLVMEESVRNDPNPEQAADILAKRIAEGKLQLPNWDENVEKWIARVRWTAQTFPEHPLPQYDDNDFLKILRILCYGETTYRAVKAKDCLDAARHLLPPNDIQFVESMAPAQITLPKGRRMKIDYVPGQPPKGRARIQDIYDMTSTIRVAGGRIPILMDILAPNNRTVQITQDMESFWAVQYPKIKPALSRRYPKHEWR